VTVGEVVGVDQDLDDLSGEAMADRQDDVCRSHGPARQTTDYLTQAGFTAETMDGGVVEWASSGLPFTAGEGSQGRVA
jgi:hypothetical protein